MQSKCAIPNDLPGSHLRRGGLQPHRSYIHSTIAYELDVAL